MRVSFRVLRERIGASGTLIRYGGASVLLQGANALSGFVVLRWLDPTTVGLWQTILLVGTYLQFLQGGVLHGLGRELPFSMGRGEDERVRALAGTGRAVALAAAALCIAGAPIAWFALSSERERWGMLAVLAGTAATIYRLYLGATYRAARAFEQLAKIQLLETILSIGTLAMVHQFGYAGLAFRLVVQSVGGAALSHYYRPLRALGEFEWRRCRELFVVGVPLFLFAYLSDVARTIPRLVMLAMGGVNWVGLFAPASAIVGAIWMIPSALGTYVYPQMSHRLGRTGDPASLWPMARRLSLWSLAVGAPIAAVAVAVAPLLLREFFPAYAGAAHATQWTAAAGVFMGASVAVNALASLKAYRWMFSFVAARFGLLLVFPWLGAQFVGGITGVAAGMATAYGLDFFVVLGLVRLATRSASTGPSGPKAA